MPTTSKLVDAYYFCVGGAVGRNQAIARPTGYRCAATKIPDAIERLLRAYLADRKREENFRQFSARLSDRELRTVLAGAELEPVIRDSSSWTCALRR